MGTSTNQASPATPNWRVAHLAYVDESITIERAVQEIWRAATNQGETDLVSQLASSVVATCSQLASSVQSKRTVAAEVPYHIAASGEATLGSEIAYRALVKTVGREGDLHQVFAASLFAEASDYLVSRDLPGFVGRTGRCKTIAEAIEFKSKIRDSIVGIVNDRHSPPVHPTSAAWRNYVMETIEALRGPGSRS
jgi:hypothetical protein